MVRPGSFRREFSVPLNALQGELNKLVEQYWPSWAPGPHRSESGERPAPAWSPAVDLRETLDEIQLEIDLPGVPASAIELTVDGRVLTLKGERPGGPAAAGNGPGAPTEHLNECPSGPFSRQVTLPSEVDADAVSADLRNGVLQVRLPKAEAAKVRQIPIQQAPLA